jgi:hypothetical protein
MKTNRMTILALVLAGVSVNAQQNDGSKKIVCSPPGKDEVCFDARTTGSLGQMHVRKSKKLVVTHLNRVKNDYQLQRGVTVQTAQTDLLSGLSFIPTAPGNPPSTTSQAGAGQTATGNSSKPPTQSEAGLAASLTDITPLLSSMAIQPAAPRGPGRRAVAQPAPVFTAAAAQRYLDLYSETAANNILATLAPGGFSATDLKTIKTAMTDAASAIISKMSMDYIANAMQNRAQQTGQDAIAKAQDAIAKAEAAAYVTSAPYIQHMQFQALANNLDNVSVSLTKLQQDLFNLKDKVAKADRDLADALASAQSFAVASDALDPTSRIEHLKDQIDQLMKVTTGPDNWPFKERASSNAEMLELKRRFAVLATLPGYSDWKGTDGVKDQLTSVSSALDADVTYINGLNPDNNDRVTALGKAKAVLAHFQWVYSLKGTPDLTQIEDEFACNDDTQKADYTLIVNDLTDDKTAASVPVVTFTCYAPLSLSGGIGFNSLAERTYQLVTPAGATTSGTTTPSSTIQYDKNSSFQIAPLLLLNVRLCNLQDWGALHASFGAGVTIPASGSGTTSGTGSQPTYLGGLSVSLRDKLYFTAGPFFGRTNTLANGYSIGSSLPSGVTTIPLETKFSAGIGVAVTFKLK